MSQANDQPKDAECPCFSFDEFGESNECAACAKSPRAASCADDCLNCVPPQDAKGECQGCGIGYQCDVCAAAEQVAESAKLDAGNIVSAGMSGGGEAIAHTAAQKAYPMGYLAGRESMDGEVAQANSFYEASAEEARVALAEVARLQEQLDEDDMAREVLKRDLQWALEERDAAQAELELFKQELHSQFVWWQEAKAERDAAQAHVAALVEALQEEVLNHAIGRIARAARQRSLVAIAAAKEASSPNV